MSRVRHKHSTSVFVALMRDEEVCLLRRKGTGWLDGSFSLPAGGLDAGETIADAACREVLEEVGVQIASASMRYAHALHSLTEGMDWVGHFFPQLNGLVSLGFASPISTLTSHGRASVTCRPS